MAGPARYAGWTDYSSDSEAKFIPEVWSGMINDKFYATTCLSRIANTRWEREIKGYGDTVKIRTGPNITWTDGEIGEEINYTQPNSTAIELHINRLKRFGIIMDSVDKIQSDLDLWEMWTKDAAEQKRIVVEKDVFAHIYTSAGHTGSGLGELQDIDLGAAGTPRTVTKDNVLDLLIDFSQLKAENNCPESGKWTVIPPWMGALILRSDLKDASLAGDATSIIRKGMGSIGMIGDEEIFISNNLETVVDGGARCTHILSGHPKGLAFGSQIDDIKSGVSEKYDGDWMRGKVAFGYLCNVPEVICHGYVTKG